MANLAAGSAGAPNGTEDLEESFEIVPRPLEETETPHVPAAQNQTSSWADETAVDMPIKPAYALPISEGDASTPATSAATATTTAAAPTPVTPADDGFHEVERRRGGQHRGHRGDGEGRGRGGRGRGGFRGERGEHRGGRGGFLAIGAIEVIGASIAVDGVGKEGGVVVDSPVLGEVRKERYEFRSCMLRRARHCVWLRTAYCTLVRNVRRIVGYYIA